MRLVRKYRENGYTASTLDRRSLTAARQLLRLLPYNIKIFRLDSLNNRCHIPDAVTANDEAAAPVSLLAFL